jgi:hypothetical protein
MTMNLPLSRDLAAYQDVVKSFGIPELNDRFDMLRQLGNSFIVQPDVLRSYLTEAHLGKVDARLLRPYLAQRSDYASFSRRFLEDEGLSGQEQLTDDNFTKGLSRGSRLSIGAGAGMSRLRDLLKAVDEHAFGHERRTIGNNSAINVKDVSQGTSNDKGRSVESTASKPARQSHLPPPNRTFVMPIV